MALTTGPVVSGRSGLRTSLIRPKRRIQGPETERVAESSSSDLDTAPVADAAEVPQLGAALLGAIDGHRLPRTAGGLGGLPTHSVPGLDDSGRHRPDLPALPRIDGAAADRVDACVGLVRQPGSEDDRVRAPSSTSGSCTPRSWCSAWSRSRPTCSSWTCRAATCW